MTSINWTNTRYTATSMRGSIGEASHPARTSGLAIHHMPPRTAYHTAAITTMLIAMVSTSPRYLPTTSSERRTGLEIRL